MRARPTGRRTSIVALTASAFDEERDAILEAGADAVLRKPCREGDLLEEIRKQLGVDYQYGEPPPPERTSHVPDVMAMRHEHVRVLPPKLVADLREAVHAADYERLTELIGQIPAEQGAVAEALRELCERYGYEEIETILGS
jgi:CheY-like chemotaxis protein